MRVVLSNDEGTVFFTQDVQEPKPEKKVEPFTYFERLGIVQAWITTLFFQKPERFHMPDWFAHLGDEHETLPGETDGWISNCKAAVKDCGTAACAYGTMLFVYPDGYSLQRLGRAHENGGGPIPGIAYAVIPTTDFLARLGLDNRESHGCEHKIATALVTPQDGWKENPNMMEYPESRMSSAFFEIFRRTDVKDPRVLTTMLAEAIRRHSGMPVYEPEPRRSRPKTAA